MKSITDELAETLKSIREDALALHVLADAARANGDWPAPDLRRLELAEGELTEAVRLLARLVEGGQG
jgi:hypothetical protein